MSASAESMGRAMHAPRATEHISIEAEPDHTTPVRVPRRAGRTKYSLVSRLRGCATEVAILDDHFVSVVASRPRTPGKKYSFDLRFADPKPHLVRHISWFWLAIALGLAGLGGVALWQAWPLTTGSWLGVL